MATKTTGSNAFRKNFRGFISADPFPGWDYRGEPDHSKESDKIEAHADLDKLEGDTCLDREGASRAITESVTAPDQSTIKPPQPVVTLQEQDGSLIQCSPTGPSGKTVCLAEEIEWMEVQFGKYVALPKGTGVILALWCVNTYTYQNFRYCPYLALVSATPQCGKTRLLNLLGAMSYGNPQPTTMPTPAVLFRRTGKVILLDEVDKLRNQDKDTHGSLIAVLNAGFEAGGKVERIAKDAQGGYEVEAFDVYGPKALAGIESVTDTIASRSLVIHMERAIERKPRLNMRLLGAEFASHRQRLEQWAEQQEKRLKLIYEYLPTVLPAFESFPDRMQDITEPFHVLAQIADADRSDEHLVLPRLIEGLHGLNTGYQISSRERGLHTILDFAECSLTGTSSKSVTIPSHNLLDECQRSDELSWMQHPSALAGFLKHFNLTPKSNGTVRGYTFTLEWVEKMRRIYPRPA